MTTLTIPSLRPTPPPGSRAGARAATVMSFAAMACGPTVCPEEDIQKGAVPSYSAALTIDLRDTDGRMPPDASAPLDEDGGMPSNVQLNVETDAGTEYISCDDACLASVNDPALSCTALCKVLVGDSVTLESCQFSASRSCVTCNIYSPGQPAICDWSDVPGSGG